MTMRLSSKFLYKKKTTKKRNNGVKRQEECQRPRRCVWVGVGEHSQFTRQVLEGEPLVPAMAMLSRASPKIQQRLPKGTHPVRQCPQGPEASPRK